MDWQALPARQFYLILGGGVLLASVALVSGVVVPQYKRLAAAEAAFASLPSPPADIEALQAQLNQRDARIVELGSTLHGDRAQLPAREMEAFVIDRLQSNAWRHDVSLQSVVPRTGDSIEKFQELVFDLTLTGRYRDLFRWLHQLHAELGFVVVKELRLSPAGRQQTDPLLEARVTLASYRRERG